MKKEFNDKWINCLKVIHDLTIMKIINCHLLHEKVSSSGIKEDN